MRISMLSGSMRACSMGAANQLPRMARHELVDRIARRNQHGQRQIATPPCPPEPLPKPGHRPRIPSAHDGIERADVDAELERVRRHDTSDLALSERRLNAPPGLRQIATSIRMNRRWVDLIARQPVPEILEHHFDPVAGVAEDQSRDTGAHQILGEPAPQS